MAARVAAVRIRVSPPAGQACAAAAALARLRAGEAPDSSQLLGCENNERSLRFGLERTYRTQAQLTSGRRRRAELVDLANSVRPSTWS